MTLQGSQGKELWKRVLNKSSSLNQGEDEEVADGLSDNIIEISKKMDFHNYVNKEITFVRSKGIMMYARGKTYTNKHWLKGAPEIWP